MTSAQQPDDSHAGRRSSDRPSTERSSTDPRSFETPVQVDSARFVHSFCIVVEAAAAELYALVADPHRHHELDGSQTVRPQAVGPHRLTTGSRFSVHMKKYGVPYRLPLQVTQAVPPGPHHDGVLEWRQPTGHRWRWEFAVLDDAGTARTLVTESYDAQRQNKLVRAILDKARIPAQNAESIKSSLRRLRQAYSSGKGSTLE